MPTFEENHTAWIDGLLQGEELARFERELSARGESLAERDQLRQLSHFLREQTPVPTLENPDFFNHQILERIRRETPESRPRFAWFGLPRLAWVGGLSLSVALALFVAIIPKKSETHSTEAFIAQVISARSADPTVTATALNSTDSDGDGVAVVWLDGLDYVPQEPPHVR